MTLLARLVVVCVISTDVRKRTWPVCPLAIPVNESTDRDY